MTEAVSTVAQQEGQNQVVSNGTQWTQIRMRICRIGKSFCICLKIMVSPVRIRVPPLSQHIELQVKLGVKREHPDSYPLGEDVFHG